MPSNLDDFIKSEIHKKTRINPSTILVNILASSIKEMEAFRKNELATIKGLYLRYVTSGVYVFIDGFDRTLDDTYKTPNNEGYFTCDVDIWKAGQIGLMLASYRMNSDNQHIKVFVSIRHEAYSSLVSEDTLAMLGCTLNLRYNKEQLRCLFSKALNYYERKDIFGFFGMTHIDNEVTKEKEEIFDYIYRHTIGTPRAIIGIGDCLSKITENGEMTQAEIKNIINDQSGQAIFTYFDSEMKKFLSSLTSRERFNDLMALINSNIMDYQNLVSISGKFKRDHHLDNQDLHLFCDLYNIGLMGVYKRDVATNRGYQSFNMPFNFSWNTRCILPVPACVRNGGHEIIETKPTEFFIIHPALYPIIMKYNPNFYISPHITIGNEKPWINEKLKKEIYKFFISYSTNDSDKVIKITKLIYAKLSEYILCEPWLDRWNIRTGASITQEIDKGLDDSNILLLMLSKDSSESEWVKKEWEAKFSQEIESGSIQLIVVFLEDNINEEILPLILRDKAAIYISDNIELNNQQIHKLCNDIGTEEIQRRNQNW